MGAEFGSLPGLGALSHLGGTAFGTTAHAAVHGAVHDTFMTLPPYTRISEGEVHELGLGVKSCFHSARSDPWSEKRERIERAFEATSAEGTARCASRGPFMSADVALPQRQRRMTYANNESSCSTGY